MSPPASPAHGSAKLRKPDTNLKNLATKIAGRSGGFADRRQLEVVGFGNCAASHRLDAPDCEDASDGCGNAQLTSSSKPTDERMRERLI
jgi:hypothetical protein